MLDQSYWHTMRKEVVRFIEGCRIHPVSKSTALNAGLYIPFPIIDLPSTNVSMNCLLGFKIFRL